MIDWKQIALNALTSGLVVTAIGFGLKTIIENNLWKRKATNLYHHRYLSAPQSLQSHR